MTEEDILIILKDLNLEKIKILHNSEDTNIQFCCPFHGERRPSCGISVNKCIGKCFSCGETFNLEKLISYCKNISYKEALEYLESYKYTDDRKVSFNTLNRYEDKYVKEDRFTQPLYEIATYKSGKVISPYFEKRGFNEHDVQKFSIGWDSEQKRITIPIFWEDGSLCGVIGRAVSSNNLPRYKVYNFPKGEIVYPLKFFKPKSATCIVVEGSLDAIWGHKLGHEEVISILGASVSEAQLDLIEKSGVKQVILALDNDSAGENGCKKFYEKAKRRFVFKRLVYPENKKDMQELTKEELEKCIEEAVIYPYNKIKKIM